MHNFYLMISVILVYRLFSEVTQLYNISDCEDLGEMKS